MRRLEEARKGQQQHLGFRIAEIRRSTLHMFGHTHLAARIIKYSIDNLIVHDPKHLIFRALKYAKKGKSDPVLGDRYLLKK